MHVISLVWVCIVVVDVCASWWLGKWPCCACGVCVCVSVCVSVCVHVACVVAAGGALILGVGWFRDNGTTVSVDSCAVVLANAYFENNTAGECLSSCCRLHFPLFTPSPWDLPVYLLHVLIAFVSILYDVDGDARVFCYASPACVAPCQAALGRMVMAAQHTLCWVRLWFRTRVDWWSTAQSLYAMSRQ